MKKVFALLVIVLICATPYIGFAEDIKLDGKFDDWDGMPGITDKLYDEDKFHDITQIKWLPDHENDRLYIFAERLFEGEMDPSDKYADWDFNLTFRANGERIQGEVSYHPPSEQVEIKLENKNGKFIWSAKGKWGDNKYEGKKVEFYLPISTLLGDIPGGYEIEMFVKSGDDRAPDKNYIIVSTVSTYAIWNLIAIMLLLGGTTFLVYRKRRKEC